MEWVGYSRFCLKIREPVRGWLSRSSALNPSFTLPAPVYRQQPFKDFPPVVLRRGAVMALKQISEFFTQMKD
jgi:hypothetical protein